MVELEAVLTEEEGSARRRGALGVGDILRKSSSGSESLDMLDLRAVLGRRALPPPSTTPGGGVGKGG